MSWLSTQDPRLGKNYGGTVLKYNQFGSIRNFSTTFCATIVNKESEVLLTMVPHFTLTFIKQFQLKEVSIMRNWIPSKAAILNVLEAAICRSHVLQISCFQTFQKLFRKIFVAELLNQELSQNY